MIDLALLGGLRLSKGESTQDSPAASIKEGMLTMSDTTQDGYSPSGYGPGKTMAVRLTEDVRAQLDILAQLNDRTVTEEIRLAIEAWITASKADPAIQQRAEYVRGEIEREAITKRNAISAIFDATTPKKVTTRTASKGVE